MLLCAPHWLAPYPESPRKLATTRSNVTYARSMEARTLRTRIRIIVTMIGTEKPIFLLPKRRKETQSRKAELHAVEQKVG